MDPVDFGMDFPYFNPKKLTSLEPHEQVIAVIQREELIEEVQTAIADQINKHTHVNNVQVVSATPQQINVKVRVSLPHPIDQIELTTELSE